MFQFYDTPQYHSLPPVINKNEVNALLVLFAAQTLRFAKQEKNGRNVPVVRQIAAVLCESKGFQETRISQWHDLLDKDHDQFRIDDITFGEGIVGGRCR